MKKRLIVLIVCMLTAIGIFGLVSCSAEKLGKPKNLHIDDSYGNTVIVWSEVKNAKNYIVRINGVSKQTRRTEMELSRFDIEEGENVTVYVKACSEDYSDSDWATAQYQKPRRGEFVYTEYIPGEYAVSKGAASGEIKIVDEYNGLPVTMIARDAFVGSTSITKVEIGKNIKKIDVQAFVNCSYLTEIVFAEDGALEEIGTSAFQNCIGLTELALPDTLKSLSSNAFMYCRNLSVSPLPDSLTIIGESAFEGCEKLETIEIPENVTYIGSKAFYECTALKNIKISGKSVSIGNSAFFKCGMLAEGEELTDENKMTVDLGNGVIGIGATAFGACTALDSIVIPDSTIRLGTGAFNSCLNLASIKLGSGITEIGGAAFTATKLWNDADNYVIVDKWLVARKNVEDTNGDFRSFDIVGIAYGAFANGKLTGAYQLPNSLVYINDYAFYKCQMASVTVGNSVTDIGDYAFSECEFLKTVVLGNSVERIGNHVFAKCAQLTATSSTGNKNVNIPRSVKSIGYNTFGETALATASEDVMVVDNWVVGCNTEARGALELPSGTVGIADGAFMSCESVTSIYIPSTVQVLGVSAFFGCISLQSVTIPSGIKEIGYSTFYNCKSLGSITIPSSVELIDGFAFRACAKLESVIIPDSVKHIGQAAFSFCDYLANVTIGNSVEEIDEYAFAYCVSLSKIALPDSLTKISDYAFYRCSALAEIDFGNGVQSVGNRAFYQCTMLSELDMPDNITSIGDYAFYKCKAMWKLKIGENVSTVGDYAFYGCINLRKVIIPDSVESIGDFAFMNCANLRAVTLGINLTSLGKHVFMNCRGLTVFAEANNPYSTWNGLWNSQYRPVVYGCVLADDKSYVVSITVSRDLIANGNADSAIFAPMRHGKTFVGWSLSADGGTVDYTASDIRNAPDGTTLYSVWDDTETKPIINVKPDYAPGWDQQPSIFG